MPDHATIPMHWLKKLEAAYYLLTVVAAFSLLYVEIRLLQQKQAGPAELRTEFQDGLKDVSDQFPKIERSINQVAEGSRKIGQQLADLERNVGENSDRGVFHHFMSTLKERYPAHQASLDRYAKGVEMWRNKRPSAVDALPALGNPLGGGAKPPEFGNSLPAPPDFLSAPEKELLSSLAEASKSPQIIGKLGRPLENYQPLEIKMSEAKPKTAFARALDYVTGYRGVSILLVLAILSNLIAKNRVRI